MRRKGKWTRIHREDMNPYIFDGVRCEACKMCFGLPTPYCPNCGAKMQDNEDFEVGILVEVVRCKDCKYWTITSDGFGECNVMEKQFLGDDYCSFGERKEDNEWRRQMSNTIWFCLGVMTGVTVMNIFVHIWMYKWSKEEDR